MVTHGNVSFTVTNTNNVIKTGIYIMQNTIVRGGEMGKMK